LGGKPEKQSAFGQTTRRQEKTGNGMIEPDWFQVTDHNNSSLAQYNSYG
jgi:hypothetical protein